MKTTTKVSVVIPCYNEKERILPVIDAITNHPLIGEIIVVDDGSEIETKNILKKIDSIKLITHSSNQGKSQAMKTGVLNANYDYVVFMDADITGFTTKHFTSLVDPVINHNYDLAIGERERDLLIFRIIGLTTALAGERVFKRELLLEHLELFNQFGYVKGYLVESLMNQQFFGKCKVAKVLLPNIGNHYKYTKTGFPGFVKDFQVLRNIAVSMGLKTELEQLKYARELKYFRSAN
jgi:glycosyltransferase involved in cell wall biosynthesis